MSTQYDEPYLNEYDDQDGGALTDDELAAAIEWLHGGRDPLVFYPTPVTRRRKPDAAGRTVADVQYRPRTARNPQTVSDPVDNTTARNPIAGMYQAALDALRAHPNYADAMAAALDAIRAWRHLQPHTAAADFASLDAVLDAAALSADVPLPRYERPASLPEAVAAHRAVMDARRQALAATRLVWDGIEAAAIRDIDRHLHGA
ncbi:hypothetical protein [Streptomyces flaveolus]|uniref:hypothetical protein n=1 Tax=Streptomyces flaveolus TaxID=67297 RepID=UPI001E542276|nr:hypothetical protein [Streptomyces flaveolus]